MEIKYDDAAFRFVRGLVYAVACSWEWFLARSPSLTKSTIREVTLTTRPAEIEIAILQHKHFGNIPNTLEKLLALEWPGLTFHLPALTIPAPPIERIREAMRAAGEQSLPALRRSIAAVGWRATDFEPLFPASPGGSR